MADTSHMTLELGLNPFALDGADLPTHDKLQREAEACQRCLLHEARTRVAFADGPTDADLMLVGHAPARHEDLQGRPFTGAAGNLLDHVLEDLGIAREDAYVTNLVKCRPPSQRLPERAELDACSRYLLQQIALVRPRVIVTLGEFTTHVLLGRSVPMARVAGYRFDLYGTTLIPTYHPADAVHGGPQLEASIRRDLRVAAGVLDGRVPSAATTIARHAEAHA